MPRCGRHLLLLAAAVVLAATAPATAQAPSPAEIVKSLYDRVAAFCNADNVDPAYDDAVLRATFDKPLADRYLQKQRRNQIDFDIFVDGQDCKLANVKIEPQDAAAGSASVRVSFDNFDAARAIDFQFRNTGTSWMIADMIYRHRKFSLRSFLAMP
jgi:ABC-type transporter MlaC component